MLQSEKYHSKRGCVGGGTDKIVRLAASLQTELRATTLTQKENLPRELFGDCLTSEWD
jgi:hypothetical protein